VRVITLHRGNRLDRLAESLGEMLRRPLPDAARPEIVSVQSQPMRAWLQMRLAERLGICANVAFPFPRELIGELLRAVLDAEARRPDPFQREVLAWSIMDLLPSLLGRASFEPLARYLAGGPDGTCERRFQLARRIADTFDQYVLYRPEMVLAWDAGQPQGPDGPLAEGDRWQMELWQALVERHGPGHVAARVRAFCQRAPEAAERLPRRLFLFGITALPPLYLDVLSHLPAGVEAHLFLHSLSPSLPERARAAGDGAEPAGNCALAVLGRQARSFERLLLARAAVRDAGDGLFHDPAASGPGSPSLLRALQAGIFHDRDVADAPAADGTLSLHSCHGRLREVEALRDRLLDLFARDPSLEPSQVAVLAPDIEEYAPLIDAVFGGLTEPKRIPYAIAGRPLRAASPLLEAFFAILDMAQRRCTLSEVFDLLSLDPVRQKFALSPDEVEELGELARGAGIRWGRDASHRQEHSQPALEDFTFRFGLDRLLLGVAMPQDRLFGGVCPFPGPAGKEAHILGRLSAFCEALFAMIADWARPRALDAWQRDLRVAIERMLADEERASADRQHLHEALAALAQRARTAGFAGDVDLVTVRGALAEELSSEPARGRIFSGGVTFASLLPMRLIPFRAIGLLGMSDDGFPRARGGTGFDLIVRRPQPGDRSLRDDDLLQFLEAAMAAGEHLLVVYPGQGIRDNQPRPPSVAVAALLETLPPAVRGAIEARHPLQPFSRRYFDGSDARLFSYDERYLESARGDRTAAPRPFLDAPLAGPGRGAGARAARGGFFA
jgi:exodeoxyribonuclease V gamma subunit